MTTGRARGVSEPGRARAAMHPATRCRVDLTVSCRDTDGVPKVPGAGTVVEERGRRVQIMHEGTRVLAGGYHGHWMEEIIRGLEGHHEPQEELLFHHLLEHVRPRTRFVELGCFWAYYTNWYLGAVPGSSAVCVEPSLANLEVGRTNVALNGRKAVFVHALVGAPRPAGADGVEQLDMDALLDRVGRVPVEVLHMDVQGAELPFIRSLRRAVDAALVRFVVVSTHDAAITGSPTTHADCVRELESLGAAVLAEHSVEESFSGDGLVIAAFHATDRGIRLPAVSRNRSGVSLFAPQIQPPGTADATAARVDLPPAPPLARLRAWMAAIGRRRAA